MLSAVCALLLSFICTLALTPAVRRWATRSGVVDQPGGRRVHEEVTPRLGGVSVMIGFFIPLALFALVQTNAMLAFLQEPGLVMGLVAGSIIVGVVGAVDDIRGVGPWPKLAAQAAAATTAYYFGYRIEAVDVPILGELHLGYFALPCTLLWFLMITNAINLIDGLDGLASGICFFAAAANFVIAEINGSRIVVLLSASLGGSLLGFLRYNFNPATIFLGDAGSMFLGFVLAATSLAGATTKSSAAIAILAPLIALGVPIMDTMLAMVRRTVARQSIFAADRGHIHHRLLDLGITQRRVVLTLYLSSILLAAAALGIAFGRSWQYGCALALAGAVLFYLVRTADALRRAERPLSTRAQQSRALQSLQQRVRKSVATLSSCQERRSVGRCLAELGADKRIFYAVELVEGALEAPHDIEGTLERAFRLDRQGSVLRVRFNSVLAPLASEATQELQAVADACARVLSRSEAQALSGHEMTIIDTH